MDTIICPHCKQPHVSSARFCPNTGKAIPPPVTPPNATTQIGNAKIESPSAHLSTNRLYDMLLGATAITLLGICMVIPIGIWVVFLSKPLPPENTKVPSTTATLQTFDSLAKATADASTESVVAATPTLSMTDTLTPFPMDTPQPTPTATTFINYYTPLPSLTPSLTPTPTLRLTPGKGLLRMNNNMTVNIRIILNTNNLTYDVEKGKTREEYPPLGIHGWQIIAGTCKLFPSALRIDPTATVTVFAPSAGKCEVSIGP